MTRRAKDCIIRIVGSPDPRVKTPYDGRYVVRWNPHTKAGLLDLTTTANIAKATRFSFETAMEEWRTISQVEKVRPWDGQPNRPLTAVTIEVLRQA